MQATKDQDLNNQQPDAGADRIESGAIVITEDAADDTGI
jgi:hypothetical protein